LIYYGGFTYSEAYHLPVQDRHWFLRRLIEELEKSNANGEAAPTRAAHQNTPDVRAMQNRTRTQTPSRLRRFT
jgi:hypothetical protein